MAAKWVGRRDAGLGSAAEAEFQSWIEADPRHRDAVAFHAAAWQSLAKPAQSGCGAALERELKSLAQRRKWRRGAMALAAVLTVSVVGLVATMRAPTPAHPVPVRVVGAPERQVLPDGSVVELKAGARIDVAFSSGARRVTLVTGEAHFTVKKDAERPFVVAAGEMEVRAVGTAFSVQLGLTEIAVVVTEGRVALQKPASATLAVAADSAPSSTTSTPHEVAAGAEPPVFSPLATLDAGSGLVVNREAILGDETRIEPVPVEELPKRLAWRTTLLEFTRIPLSEAVALFNAHGSASSPVLALGDPSIAGIRVSGIFRADNTEAFVHLLEGGFGLVSRREGNCISLFAKDR